MAGILRLAALAPVPASSAITRPNPSLHLAAVFPSFNFSILPPNRSSSLSLSSPIGGSGSSSGSLIRASSSSPHPSPFNTKLYVSGLSFRTTEQSLRNAFEKFGKLVEVKLVMDKVANRPRGFAFLRYETDEESQNAVQGMHGKFLDGRVIFVEVAKPRSELPQREKRSPQP